MGEAILFTYAGLLCFGLLAITVNFLESALSAVGGKK